MMVELAAFSGCFIGSKLVLSKWRCLVSPTGNSSVKRLLLEEAKMP
jgi:hypothetical protein